MLITQDLENAAKEAAGNWQRFNCFVWFRDREIEDPQQWAIIYTHNRESRLLDQSNAAFIAKAMEPFTEADEPDVVFESHNHWAVGHVDGFSIRVFRNGEITLENIKDAAWRLKDEFILPEAWVGQVYDWLSEHRSGEIENKDDQGGYPSEEGLKAAFTALNYRRDE